MNGSWQGFAAIIAFFLLLMFFLATATGAPVAVVAPAASVNRTTTDLAAPLVNPSFPAATAEEPSALPPSVLPVNGQSAGTPYRIQPGDWLSNLARQYNTTVPAILAANPQITDPNQITPGQTILIPSATQ